MVILSEFVVLTAVSQS